MQVVHACDTGPSLGVLHENQLDPHVCLPIAQLVGVINIIKCIAGGGSPYVCPTKSGNGRREPKKIAHAECMKVYTVGKEFSH